MDLKIILTLALYLTISGILYFRGRSLRALKAEENNEYKSPSPIRGNPVKMDEDGYYVELDLGISMTGVEVPYKFRTDKNGYLTKDEYERYKVLTEVNLVNS